MPQNPKFQGVHPQPVHRSHWYGRIWAVRSQDLKPWWLSPTHWGAFQKAEPSSTAESSICSHDCWCQLLSPKSSTLSVARCSLHTAMMVYNPAVWYICRTIDHNLPFISSLDVGNYTIQPDSMGNGIIMLNLALSTAKTSPCFRLLGIHTIDQSKQNAKDFSTESNEENNHHRWYNHGMTMV